MKIIKRLMSFFVVLLMVAGLLLPTLASCGPETPDTPVDPNPDDPVVEGGYDPDATPKSYLVTVKTGGGMALSGVQATFFYKTKAGNLQECGSGTVDENGNIVKSMPTYSDYVIKLNGVPQGYLVQETYTFDATGRCNILLHSSIIETPVASGKKYQVGDIINDFTVTTSDGETFNLKEQFENGKKAVFINFWYVGCSWCAVEFPYMNEAYNKLSDDIAIIALSTDSGDTMEDIAAYKESYGLEFPVGQDTHQMFYKNVSQVDADGNPVSGNPYSIMVDRYGMITLMHEGAITSVRDFEFLFRHHIADTYTQKIITDISDIVPKEAPDTTMPSQEDIDSTVNNTGLTLTYREDIPEDGGINYSWPFILGEKGGVSALRPSNDGVVTSYSILYVDVSLKAGEAFMFDYWASCEAGADICHVIVNNKAIYQLTGNTGGWTGVSPVVADKDGTYEIAFAFTKDSDTDVGDDTVYIRNFRVMAASDIDAPSYIPTDVATHQKEDGDGYEHYATVVYSEEDGYYHVGTVDGPLLLAKLMDYSAFSGDSFTFYDMACDGLLVDAEGHDYYDDLLPYFITASNAAIRGVCTVDAKLAELLQGAVATVGLEQIEEEWLQLCYFYDAYGTNGVQLADPIRGLTSYSAFETIESEPDDLAWGDPDKEYPNYVYYDRPIMPRGLLFKFVPKTSGVYRITSKTYTDADGISAEVEGWIYGANVDDDRDGQLFTADWSERLWQDPVNLSMLFYFEQGKPYYIDIAFGDNYFVGGLYFRVEKVADKSGDGSETAPYQPWQFTAASVGPFTFEEGPIDPETGLPEQGETVVGGINVALGEDGYYHHLREDGTLGSVVYVDFVNTTHAFSNQSLLTLMKMGALDLSKNESDEEILSYIRYIGIEKLPDALRAEWGDDYDAKMAEYKVEEVLRGVYHGKYGIFADEKDQYILDKISELGKADLLPTLQAAWGEDYDAYMVAYGVEDIMNGIYHGEGQDLVAVAEKYIDLIDSGEAHPEREGCVAVNEELASILQAIMDKFSFQVEHSWTKMCYYYKDFAPNN